jgi:broad specificity phosphatase PhoE
MKLLATLMLAALALVSAPALAAEPVFIIRHLEKAAGQDPALTPQGAARAEKLADMLENKGIKAVFATAFQRAQQTAAPLARRLGVPVTSYKPDDVQALVKAVAAAGGPVLIVGHSNTVPELVAAFGGAKPAPIGEESYGTIFLVGPDADVTAIDLH